MKRILLPLAAALALPATAQDMDTPAAVERYVEMATREADQWREYGERMHEWSEEFEAEMQGSMALMFSDRVGSAKLVKGAPYSAEVVTESNRALSDGNVISHKNVNRVYRDGAGRVRQETYRNGELRSVYISDPVAGTSYALLPRKKIAIATPKPATPAPRAPRGEHDHTSGASVVRDEDRRVVIRVDDDGLPGTKQEVRVQAFRVDDDRDPDSAVVTPLPPVPPVPPLPPDLDIAPTPMPDMPGVHSLRFESTAMLGKGTKNALGTRDFDGVKAEGTSTTWTIPAGKIGNRNPINITREVWTSPELQVTVYSRYNDPRTGESIYRLAAVKRAEPAADLFKVPADYAVKTRRAMPTPPAPPAPPPPGMPAPPPPRG